MPPTQPPSTPPNPAPSASEYQHRYTAALACALETRWQRAWAEHGVHNQPNPGEPGFDATKPKFYILDMFPYPSGAGLHVGHPEGYTATDILGRYKVMNGFNVLHPMGWDAFGLPAEQYAIQTGVHPVVTTRNSIDTFRGQLQRFGFGYDWTREFGTIDEDYYRWTQWIFLRIYNAWNDPQRKAARHIDELRTQFEQDQRPVRYNPDAAEINSEARNQDLGAWNTLDVRTQHAVIASYRLAYLGEQTVNWCPKLGTALANEEVINGRSERGGFPVLRKPLRQWMFRITAYGDRLLNGLIGADWPESTRAQQAEWIGRSEGAEASFALQWETAPGGTGLRPVEQANASPGGTGLRPVNQDGTSPGGTGLRPVEQAQQGLHPVPENFNADPLPRFAPTGFQPRDPYPAGERIPEDMRSFRRHMPHIELEGATYFVTWRIADDQTLTNEEKDIVLSAMSHWDNDRCRVYACCVMPDHVHWVVRPLAGHSLSDLVSSVKKHSALSVNRLRGVTGSLWQDERFDHIIRDASWLRNAIQYVLDNACKAGLCQRRSDYPWTTLHTDLLNDRSETGPTQEAASTFSDIDRSETGHTQEAASTQRINALEIYTTRPDTMFGASYMVVAPEHPLIDALLANPLHQTDVAALNDYVTTARNRSDVDRQEGKDKTGVFTGINAINPATGQPIPVWTSDYVLMGYGTGAIMAVPAHDQRDFEFAQRFGLPIVDVVYPRVIAAMAYYSRNATAEERENPRWMTVLADLLGTVTSGDIDPAGFEAALHRVRTVRATTSDTVSARPANFEGMLTPSDRRGASQVTWIEALDSLGFDSFEALYNRFANGGFYAHSGEAYTGKGSAVNSASELIDLNAMGTENAKAAIIQALEIARKGRRKVNYRLRDWLFSRQRYWGEPFPIVFDEQGLHHPIDVSALPVKLPEMADYQPIESNDPAPLLAKATDWVRTTAQKAGATHLPPTTAVTRETNTMPGWAGSCWYYLRYCDPKNSERFASRQAEQYWMGEQGVDLYVGGSEHAVLHLLYARFWHQILFDLGEVSSPEPFKKLFHQGLILSYAFQRKDKSLVAVDAVIERDGAYYEQATGDPVTRTMAKMSKTLKNVVNPDDIIAEFGADTFRLYEMYMGPLEASAPWNTDDIIGLFRFLQRVWRLVIDESTGTLTLLEKSDPEIEKKLHRTIAKVGDDIERLAFNTAIAAMIEFVNAATGAKGLSRDQLDRFVRTLAPFCPHMADELWHRLGHDGPVAHAQWPSIDQSMLHDDQVEIPVQIMGKVRAKIIMPSDADQKAMEAIAMADERVKELLVGKTVQKVVAIPGRMVNIVAN